MSRYMGSPGDWFVCAAIAYGPRSTRAHSRRACQDHFVALFKAGWDLFRRHEVVVLRAVGDALDPAARCLLDAQVAAVRKVQRLHDAREVNLYAGRRGAPPWPQGCAFPNPAMELRLATVRLVGTAGAGQAVVYAVRGHVFQLQFRPAPKQLGDRDSIHAGHVRVHDDPLDDSVRPSTADLLGRVSYQLRCELEALWESEPTQLPLGRDGVYEFHHDAPYVMVAQLPDTTFVALRLDTVDPLVGRFEPSGEVIGTYGSIAAALEHNR